MNEEQPPKQGMGCFAKGCLTLVIVVLLLAIGGAIGGWWIYGRAVNRFTSDRPASVQTEEPASAAFQQAETKLAQLRNAIRNKTETTTDFSAADLNALIARDPGFQGVRGKTRVSMAGDALILDLSVPLNGIPLPKLKGRWFNGQAQFQFAYDLGQFSFTAHSLTTKGHRIESNGRPGFSSSFLEGFGSSFTRRFNQSFHQAEERNAQGNVFWRQIKSMSIRNDQLEVVTRGD